MANIIYAPIIGETIPGFVAGENEIIKIPFQMNPAVSQLDIDGFSLKVSDYNGNELKGSPLEKKGDWENIKDIPYLAFEQKDSRIKFESNQYYKFQLAYIGKGEDKKDNRKYSYISIGKCVGRTEDFEIQIKDLDSGKEQDNPNIFNYDGEFKRSVMESLYSYRYEFRDEDSGELLQSTNEILWNVDKDKKFEDNYYFSDLDDFKLTVGLEKNKNYILQLFCTTVNGYEIISPAYRIIKEKEEDWEKDVQGGFTATQDARAKENGYITVEAYIKKGGINNLIFERREDENGPYKTIQTFNIEQTGPFKIVWQDQVIKQGVSYTYSLRYRTDNGWTERYESNDGKPYFVDFDHIFLSDSERQLKIKFDPKVSSFKDNLLEQKTDTIGSRYPFFFRNNQIKYKEIPISGLISYHMDNDEFFMKQEDLGLNKIQNRNSTAAAGSISATGSSEVSTPATTDLVDYNIAAERKFKLEVLDWLNNGKPKLFRSPTEGNYVIRLMNVSLSPNDTLGRAIHSFSATGYECMDNAPQTLVENGLLRFEETDIKSIPAANLGVLTLGLSQLGVDWTKEKEGTNNE